MATDLGARYWTPLICLYHGNRIREVMQLPQHRVEDAAGYGLDALAPLCTPIGKQRLPNAVAKPLFTNVWAYKWASSW
jgi:hypothetical protein